MTSTTISTHAAVRAAAVFASATMTLLLITWIFHYAAYGLDFTDEGFYLVWISNPFMYSWSVTQFGFIYHFLYDLLAGDIVLLRRVNVAITYTLSWLLSYFYLSYLLPLWKGERASLLVLSAGLAVSVFSLFDLWLLTPSYDSLALQSLLLVAIGLTLAQVRTQPQNGLAWALVGIGGWLAFMAKPTTAGALAVGVLLHAIIARNISTQMVVTSVLSAIIPLTLSMFIIDGSPALFIERLSRGVEFARQLGAGHEIGAILRLDGIPLGGRPGISLAFLICLSILLWWILSGKKKIDFFSSLIVCFSSFFVLLAVIFGDTRSFSIVNELRGVLMLLFSCGVVLAGVIHLGIAETLRTPRPRLAFTLTWLIFPFIYTFGTISNYWQAGSGAAVFWVLGGLTVVSKLFLKRVLFLYLFAVAFTAQAVIAMVLSTAVEYPYRQPHSLRLNSDTLRIGPHASPVILSESYASILADAQALTRNAGFQRGTPMIDLTGASPGVLFAIGAANIGQPWTIGGYIGSLKLAESALKLVPCDTVSRAWLLLEPGGPRSLPISVVEGLGLNLEADFQLVGSWRAIQHARSGDDNALQLLYRPVDSREKLQSCGDPK